MTDAITVYLTNIAIVALSLRYQPVSAGMKRGRMTAPNPNHQLANELSDHQRL
jgi:hypothetical protein